MALLLWTLFSLFVFLFLILNDCRSDPAIFFKKIKKNLNSMHETTFPFLKCTWGQKHEATVVWGWGSKSPWGVRGAPPVGVVGEGGGGDTSSETAACWWWWLLRSSSWWWRQRRRLSFWRSRALWFWNQ